MRVKRRNVLSLREAGAVRSDQGVFSYRCEPRVKELGATVALKST
jgi:hypothetical protein